MVRSRNTTTSGRSFSEGTVENVWEKGKVISGRDRSKVRQDTCGAEIHRDKYGKTIAHGWEIDHIKPVSKGGGDELSNLQPLQWENNRKKSDTVGQWYCEVTA